MFKKNKYYIQIVPTGTIIMSNGGSGGYMGRIEFKVKHNLKMTSYGTEKGNDCKRLTGLDLRALEDFVRPLNYNNYCFGATVERCKEQMAEYVEQAKNFIVDANLVVEVVEYEPIAEARDE